MRDDAFKQPYLCVDATGVLVLAKERCRSGDFWVTVAPDRHVLFAYSKRHDSAAVDELLGGYAGYLVADAHAVYDHATVLVCSAVAPPLFAFLFLWSTRPEPIPNGAPPSATSRSPFAWTAIVLGSVMVALGVLNQLIRSSRMKIDLTLREGNGGFVVIGAVVASIGFLRVNRRR